MDDVLSRIGEGRGGRGAGRRGSPGDRGGKDVGAGNVGSGPNSLFKAFGGPGAGNLSLRRTILFPVTRPFAATGPGSVVERPIDVFRLEETPGRRTDVSSRPRVTIIANIFGCEEFVNPTRSVIRIVKSVMSSNLGTVVGTSILSRTIGVKCLHL